VVCPSPSFQRVMYFDHVVSGSVNRASKVKTFASGKGVNCSRAIARIGGSARNLLFLGGETGRGMALALKNEKFRSLIIPVSSNTRSCVTVICRKSGVSELIENSPKLNRKDEEKIQNQFRRALPSSDLVVCIGSIPKGISSSFYRQIAIEAARKNVRVLIDAEGEALLKALRAKPWLVKFNHLEFASTFRLSTRREGWIQRGILKAHRLGAARVIVTKSDAVYVSDGRWVRRLKVPLVKVKNTVGAGDTFIGVLAHMLSRGKNLFDSARFATACASAAVTGNGYGDFKPSLARMLKVY
jgi:tagatose 6-phosphate kinase